MKTVIALALALMPFANAAAEPKPKPPTVAELQAQVSSLTAALTAANQNVAYLAAAVRTLKQQRNQASDSLVDCTVQAGKAPP